LNLRPSAPKACHSATVCLPGQTQVTNERKPPSCGVWKRSWPLPWQTINTHRELRTRRAARYTAAQSELNQTYGVINTLLVPSSSLFVALGVKAVRTEAGAVAPKLIGMAWRAGSDSSA